MRRGAKRPVPSEDSAGAATFVSEDDNFGYLATFLARLFIDSLRRRYRPLGVGPGQYPVIKILAKTPGLTQSELAVRMRVEQPTLANTLKRMEREQLVRRIPDHLDQRRVRLQLSAKALDLKALLESRGKELEELAFQGIPGPERRKLKLSVLKIISNLDGSD